MVFCLALGHGVQDNVIFFFTDLGVTQLSLEKDEALLMLQTPSNVFPFLYLKDLISSILSL